MYSGETWKKVKLSKAQNLGDGHAQGWVSVCMSVCVCVIDLKMKETKVREDSGNTLLLVTITIIPLCFILLLVVFLMC